MGNPIDLTGHTYGRLTVVSQVPNHKGKRAWECLCQCGNTKTVIGEHLRRGATVSCGCYHKENHTTHGGSKSRLYSIWHGMLQRCYNKTNPNYPYYGGIGVVVCSEWYHSFSVFRTWAVNNGYTPQLSIDRKSGTKVYSPSTSHWTTKTIQARNRRASTGKSSSYIGVYHKKSHNVYIAQIQVNKQTLYLGTFSTERQAALARNQYIKDNSLEGYTLNVL